MITKYIPKQDAWTGLVANANVGGENVHRGCILSTILQAQAGYNGLPSQLENGLCDKASLAKEIDEFIQVVRKDE
jgi:ADP-ribosylglycohydrolase